MNPTPPIPPVRRAIEQHDQRTGKRLFVGGERSVRRTLFMRAAAVLTLYAIVILVFWIGREGLRDNYDNRISFSDVVYFSMVTVTTVGYGDVVPVTRSARLIDAIFVTPIRLVIWLVFLGTTYQLVLQRLVEDLRMRRLQAKLANHIVVCGFTHSGACVAHELVGRGMGKHQILIVDRDRKVLEDAAEQGFIGILGDATREETMREAMLANARAVFVCTDRDDTNVLIVLTARQIAPHIRVIARVEEAENEKLLRQSGADATILPSRVGGILMANAIENSALSNYFMDLISATGRVVLVERDVREEEIGRMPRDVEHTMIVAVIRGGREVAVDDADALLRVGDKVLAIRQSKQER
ncbi:MAG TPA: potassium channel family protein [Steroidobacteraceae bacterium]|nr:potassium channel family protein [Steroidobacteraceae bacterium]